MPSKKDDCLRQPLFVFFRIRRGTFPYSFEDDANTTSQTPTTHYTNTCVKLTIVTHLSFSERIAIANLSQSITVLQACTSYRIAAALIVKCKSFSCRGLSNSLGTTIAHSCLTPHTHEQQCLVNCSARRRGDRHPFTVDPVLCMPPTWCSCSRTLTATSRSIYKLLSDTRSFVNNVTGSLAAMVYLEDGRVPCPP